MRRLSLCAAAALALGLAVLWLGWRPTAQPLAWSAAELEILASLRWRDRAPPPEPSNRYGDDLAAARLGQRIFFDPGFSRSAALACASCHQPARNFADGQALASVAGRSLRRHTPSVVGAAYSTWQFWDGRADSLWAQALAPLEDPDEHAGTRSQYARRILSDYRADYEAVFGPSELQAEDLPAQASPLALRAEERAAWEALPSSRQQQVDRVFANIGKSLAAYQRRLRPGPSRFDRYVEALQGARAQEARALFSADEEAGLRLFIAEDGGQCLRCHNGPDLSNHRFVATGTSAQAADPGRARGVQLALRNPFNCLGPFSDAPSACQELQYAQTEGAALQGAFKVPSLRNVARSAPYMHRGQFADLRALLAYYNRPPRTAGVHNDLEALHLLPYQLRQLELFLRTLDSTPATASEWLRPPLPLGAAPAAPLPPPLVSS